MEWDLTGEKMEYSNKQKTEMVLNTFRRICKIPVLVLQIGILQIVNICSIYFFEPQIMKVIPMYAGLVKKTRLIWKKVNTKRDLEYWSSRKSEIIAACNDGMDIAELGLDEHSLKLLEREVKTTNQLVIAEIDPEGYFHSHFGNIEGVPCVYDANFIPCLNLVTVGRKVGIKKNYNDCAFSFVKEIEALYALGNAGCNVPSILDIDFENRSLTTSYIPGTVLGEQLPLKGAILRDREVDGDSRFNQLSPEIHTPEKIDERKRNLQDVVSQDFIEKIFEQVEKIHSVGFIINDIRSGNVIVGKKTGNPYLIDFESSDNCIGMGCRAFRHLRDNDIEKFNIRFGTDKPTYQGLRRKIADREPDSPETLYAPLYISSGLRIGALWDISSGWGRWHFMLKNNLPNLRGKRVLDLGANNGVNSLQILKSGAREVIGIEIDPIFIQQGQFLKSAMEWSDNQKYNFRYIQSSMAELKSMDLGSFDLVMALCSIYYLEDNEITELIRHISTINDYFIVQCNTERDIGRKNPHAYEKASVEYLKRALEENGFSDVKLVAPKHYSRPLLIGRK